MTVQKDFLNLTNLAAEKLGAKAIACSDDFFAGMENLIKEGRGIFIEGKYTENGKWMDGWESRRKRTEGHDWCIIKLGTSGIIKGVDIDTNHFTGNHPPKASLQACCIDDDTNVLGENVAWKSLLETVNLNPGSQHLHEVNNNNRYTHAKLHIYPDGGVARLKIYGEVYKNWTSEKGKEIDLAAVVNGGRSVLCSDMYFSHMGNLIMPNRGADMGDGWETKRNRTPNNRDWVIVKLGHKGTINKVLVDTCHFKGNFPDTCSIEVCNLDKEPDNWNTVEWKELLPKQKLSAHNEHYFETELKETGVVTHARLNIFPDGGISRLRLFGRL